jgi:hypothetical protein
MAGIEPPEKATSEAVFLSKVTTETGGNKRPKYGFIKT